MKTSSSPVISTSKLVSLCSLCLVSLAILVYVVYLAIYVAYAADLFQWPFDYDQGEGFELYDAILYSQGEWPYRDNAVYPFYASNYPPLFHLLIVPLLPFFGPSVVAGRVVSFVSTLVTGATIALVVRRQVGGWFIPLISGLSFWASNYIYQVGPLCRMHMTMVMFETLAVALIAGFEHPQHGRRNLLLGLLALLCAGYTKQMAIFTVIATLFYIFLRDIRQAVVAGVGLALTAGLIFWWLNYATDGQWWVNTIQANVNTYDYRQTIFLFKQWFRLHTLFVVLAVGYLAYELFWDRLSVYSLWFLFSLGSGALSGKWGAGFGYFTTGVAAACLTSGLALGRLKGVHWPTVEKRRGLAFLSFPSWTRALGGLMAVLYLIQAPRMLHLPTDGPLFGPLAQALGVDDALVYGTADQLASNHCAPVPYHDAMGYTQLGHRLSLADYTAGARILDYVRTADGPVFSEEAMFSLLAGKPVITNPTQLLNLYKNGLLDTTDIIARIEAEEFGLVIFRAQFYPPPVLEAIGQHYHPVEHVCMNGFYYHLLWPNRVLDHRDHLAE